MTLGHYYVTYLLGIRLVERRVYSCLLFIVYDTSLHRRSHCSYIVLM